jgi:hypothetical protein
VTARDDPSGAALAQAAHDAGAVTPPVEPQRTFDVILTCAVVGSRIEAERVGASLELHAGNRSIVSEVLLTVAERA